MEYLFSVALDTHLTVNSSIMNDSINTNHDPKTKPKIGIIDSGAGGISIVLEILKRIPHIEISFLADSANFPYAEQNTKDLESHLNRLISSLINEQALDLIVVACNTASTIALETLRKHHQIAFVGVVPAIKPAAKYSLSKEIMILATPNTVTHTYTKNLANKFAHDCQLSYLGSRRLVEHIENHINGEALDSEFIEKLLTEHIESHKQVDTLVLACTHFPLIKDSLKTAFIKVSNDIRTANNLPLLDKTAYKILDSGEAIARRVESLLQLKPDNKNDNSKLNNNEVLITLIATKKHDDYQDSNLEKELLNYFRYMKKASKLPQLKLKTRLIAV